MLCQKAISLCLPMVSNFADNRDKFRDSLPLQSMEFLMQMVWASFPISGIVVITRLVEQSSTPTLTEDDIGQKYLSILATQTVEDNRTYNQSALARLNCLTTIRQGRLQFLGK